MARFRAQGYDPLGYTLYAYAAVQVWADAVKEAGSLDLGAVVKVAPNSLAELDGHRGIFYTNRGIADWRFSGPDGATIVRGRTALRVNNGDMMRDAALTGLGIALLPMFIAGADIRAGRLTATRCSLAAVPLAR